MTVTGEDWGMIGRVEEPAGVRSGNRRSERASSAIIRSTLTLLGEVGYQALTIEGVAARARVGKATIYRWWPSKAALVLDALIETSEEGDPPSTNSAKNDLYSWLNGTLKRSSAQLSPTVLTSLVSDLYHGPPELLEKFRSDYYARENAVGYRTLERAVEEGSLPPDADLELILDICGGTILARALMTGGPINADFGHRVIDCVFGAPPRVSSGKTGAKNMSKTAKSAAKVSARKVASVS